LATKLLETYKKKISGLSLEPSDGGCFEVTIENELIYSKLASGSFPDESQLVSEIGERLA